MGARLTEEKFFARIHEVFGDKYDFSKMEYRGVHEYITVICPKHGEFRRTPIDLFKGKGCPECKKEEKLRVYNLTFEDFLYNAKEKHGDRYSYDKVKYVDSVTPITITCPVHGDFEIRPCNFLKGGGCPKCSKEKVIAKQRLTTEEFIRRGKEKFGDKYDYSKTEYINISTPLIVICPVHGEIKIKPNTHLFGCGCTKCSKEGISNKNQHLKFSQKEFIDRAKVIYGNKFTYEKTIFRSYNEKVIITCPEHGDFEIAASDFLSGYSCIECRKKLRDSIKSKTDFQNESFKIFGNKYDISKTDYQAIDKKISIVCPKHGTFYRLPYKYLSGLVCPKCIRESLEKNSEDVRIQNEEEFIKKAKEIHGDKYDYSKIHYVNKSQRVTLICPEHGEFTITPYGLLKGQGCKKCGIERHRQSCKSNTEEFISRATAIHDGKYDYSKSEYVNTETKVCIICPEHGEFWQTPHHHLNGVGCPYCKNSSENKLYKVLKKEFPDIERQHSEDYLKNGNGKQTVDFYIPSKNLAIEYQGRQHFVPIKSYGGEEEFARTRERDERKHRLLKEHGIRVVYFTYDPKEIPKEYLDTIYVKESQLIDFIKQYGNRL